MSSPALRPWREIVRPHTDVLENRFRQSEFAADLTAVDLGRAAPEYQDPTHFFAMTFVTEGMKNVITAAADRLSGRGGEPVIGLQAAFGGGKTHTMLALRHLAEARAAIGSAGLSGPAAKTFTFVGTGVGARQRLSRQNEPPLFTPWGVMAWRLGGPAGLALMADADTSRAAPGSERLLALLEFVGPCVVLLDELVAYARVLDDTAFEAFLSFIQSLTEACKMTQRAVVLGSLIGSDAEGGGHRGAEARRRLEKIFGRVQSSWLPAHGHEQYDIVRRRLFAELDSERERDATIGAFADLYRANPTAFPAETSERAYRDSMVRAYPMHPELFRLFSDVWSAGANERFQQTRGVLRIMACVVRELWQSQDDSPLILPGSLPLAEAPVRAAVLEPLDGNYAAVLDSEVEGSQARPQAIEAKRRSYSLARTMTRSARAVFLATAPLAGAAESGVTGPRLRLACAQPGDQINLFGDALRELAETSAFLHHDGECYWFSTEPTLNRLASDLASDVGAAEVDTKIDELLSGETTGSKFNRVHVTAGGDPTAIDDSRVLRLVILDSRYQHASRGDSNTAAMQTAAAMMQQRGAAQRQYRNALLFAAADETRLDDARWAVRRLIAWSTILSKADQELRLPVPRQCEARSRRDEAFNAARRAVRAAWSHLIIPCWPDDATAGASRGFALHAAPIQNGGGEHTIAQAAFERAARDGFVVVEKLGGRNLRMMLDRVIGDQPHVAVRDLADWSARYVHMKRLHTESLLAGAIEELIGSIDADYAWADSFDEVTGRYNGLRFGRVLFPDMRGNGVLVRVEAGRKQLGGQAPPQGLAEEQATLVAPTRRFLGVVSVDPERPGPQVARIARTVLAELMRPGETSLTMTLQITADREAGFAESVVAVVTANVAALRFDRGGFE